MFKPLPKLCPFSSFSGTSNSCIKERCEFWDNEDCLIRKTFKKIITS